MSVELSSTSPPSVQKFKCLYRMQFSFSRTVQKRTPINHSYDQKVLWVWLHINPWSRSPYVYFTSSGRGSVNLQESGSKTIITLVPRICRVWSKGRLSSTQQSYSRKLSSKFISRSSLNLISHKAFQKIRKIFKTFKNSTLSCLKGWHGPPVKPLV